MEHLNEPAFLNYHHLRYFWAAAKWGGVVRASEWLKVAQPSVSAQIRELEETIARTPAEVVVVATPIDLRHLLRIERPAVRVRAAEMGRGESSVRIPPSER
jgi:hypothetical protein